MYFCDETAAVRKRKKMNLKFFSITKLHTPDDKGCQIMVPDNRSQMTDNR
jgi:hypothetical protein